MYTADDGLTTMATYGVSNRKSVNEENKEFRCPSMAQMLPPWSEKTAVKNSQTGIETTKLYVGGSVLESFIKKMEIIFASTPRLEFVTVFMAYFMAKNQGVNLNHGFDLKLAAKEWGAW